AGKFGRLACSRLASTRCANSKVMDYSGSRSRERLPDLGKDGWEPIAATPDVCVFRRIVQEIIVCPDCQAIPNPARLPRVQPTKAIPGRFFPFPMGPSVDYIEE